MPTAICPNGHIHHWRNRRGSRLADMRCAECSEPLRAAMWKDGQYVERPASAHAGRKFMRCPLCGRRRMSGSMGVKTTRESLTFALVLASTDQQRTVEVPEGTEICWYHDARFPVRVEEWPKEGTK